MEKDIVIDNQLLHYEETGPEDGRPVILMHGWGCDHTTVRSIAQCLESGLHVFNLDLPGFGKSVEPDSVWGVPEYSQFIFKFIDKLRLKNPALIGHSYGGRVAIMMASQHPFSKMVLVDAAGIKPKRSLNYYIKVYSFKLAKIIYLIIYGEGRGAQKIAQRRAKSGSSDYQKASPKMKAVMSKSVNQDLTPLLPKIKASTLLVWGENDTATPLRDAKIMERYIPDAGLVSFPNAAHYSFLDQPGWFKSVIQEFFKPELQSTK